MTALDRTAYPRFRRKPLTGEVAATFTLSDDEIRLLTRHIGGDQHAATGGGLAPTLAYSMRVAGPLTGLKKGSDGH